MKIFTILTLILMSINISSFSQNAEADGKKAQELFNKANNLKQTYQFDEALKSFSEAADLYKKYPDKYTGNYLSCRYAVADIYLLQNKFNESKTIFDEIETLSVQKFGEGNQFLRYIYSGKASILLAKGKNLIYQER